MAPSLQGYNGSQLWDTSFAAQALCDAGLGSDDVVDKVLRKAHSYVEQSQVRLHNMLCSAGEWGGGGGWPSSVTEVGRGGF